MSGGSQRGWEPRGCHETWSGWNEMERGGSPHLSQLHKKKVTYRECGEGRYLGYMSVSINKKGRIAFSFLSLDFQWSKSDNVFKCNWKAYEQNIKGYQTNPSAPQNNYILPSNSLQYTSASTTAIPSQILRRITWNIIQFIENLKSISVLLIISDFCTSSPYDHFLHTHSSFL